MRIKITDSSIDNSLLPAMADSNHNTNQLHYFSSVNIPTIRLDNSAYTLRHLERLLAFGEFDKSESLLEVGAGVGRFSAHLTQRGYHLTACDIAPQLIGQLRKFLPHIESKVADVNKLSASISQPFDKVIGFFMLHHLFDLDVAFKSMASVLKPGGEIVFCEPNAYYIPFYIQILFTPRMRWKVDRGVMNMRPGKLFPAMRAAGFTDLRFERYGYFPPQFYRHATGRTVESWLEAFPLPDATKAFQLIRGRLQ